MTKADIFLGQKVVLESRYWLAIQRLTSQQIKRTVLLNSQKGNKKIHVIHKPKILISSCLLGEKVRFDGQGKLLNSKIFQQLQNNCQFISICPEVAGGLPIPRAAAEIIQKKPLRVVNRQQQDVTTAFNNGAEIALNLCRQQKIRFALLKAKSPSCGNAQIYDGSFSGRLKAGQGVTATLLEANGVKVFNEGQLELLWQTLQQQYSQIT